MKYLFTFLTAYLLCYSQNKKIPVLSDKEMNAIINSKCSGCRRKYRDQTAKGLVEGGDLVEGGGVISLFFTFILPISVEFVFLSAFLAPFHSHVVVPLKIKQTKFVHFYNLTRNKRISTEIPLLCHFS